MKIGYFSDPEPWVSKVVTPRKLWKVIQQRDNPFYYICSDTGLITAPIHKEYTDLRSGPELVSPIIPIDWCLPAWLIHDDEYFRKFALRPLFPYTQGDENLNTLITEYVFEDDEVKRLARARENFEIVRLDRRTADYTLSECIYTYPPTQDQTFKRFLVYRAVRVGGLFGWNRKSDQRDTALKIAWANRLPNNGCEYA